MNAQTQMIEQALAWLNTACMESEDVNQSAGVARAIEVLRRAADCATVTTP